MTKTIDEKLAGTNPEEWTEATVAAYHEDGTHARLQRHLDPSRIGDETSLRRAVAMIRAMGSVLNGPYTGSELPVRLLGPSVALRRAPDLWARYEDELLQEVFAFMSKPGMEATFRSAVTFDLDDVTVRRLFSELGADRAEQVAAIDEQLRAEGRMRGTSAETKRR
jgi:hypothetical protein